MRRAFLPLMLSLAACNGDLAIAPNQPGAGVGDAPDLATPVKTDKIVQVIKPQVDVLWIVDDSCSMIEEQQKLTESFSEFIKFFLDSGLDWHIGVLSTDMSAPAKKGRLIPAGGYRYLTPQVPNPVSVFAAMAKLGTGGSPTEKGLLAAFTALVPPGTAVEEANRGFYREDASLHMVVISDEEDQSAPTMTKNEFVTFLQGLKSDPDVPVTFSSIVGPVPAGCKSPDADAYPGTIYIAVTNATDGVFRSICEEDWGPVLEELGLKAAGLRREYFLSEIPVPGTIDVWVVDGDQQNDGINLDDVPPGGTYLDVCEREGLTGCFPYSYDQRRNSILMEEYVPSPLAEINISYQLLSGLQSSDEVDLGNGSVDTGDAP